MSSIGLCSTSKTLSTEIFRRSTDAILYSLYNYVMYVQNKNKCLGMLHLLGVLLCLQCDQLMNPCTCTCYRVVKGICTVLKVVLRDAVLLC